MDKILKAENFTKIANILCLREIGGSTYGSHKLKQKILTVFKKLAQCYELYGPSRELCQHEVEILCIRCYSYGNWFPVNFPEAQLKRKFHILVFHVPEKARLADTVGMEADHVAEFIQPVCVRYERAAATIQNIEQKMKYIVQATELNNDSNIPNMYEQQRRK